MLVSTAGVEAKNLAEAENHGRFDNLTDEQKAEMERLLSRLSPVQQQTFRFVQSSYRKIILIYLPKTKKKAIPLRIHSHIIFQVL